MLKKTKSFREVSKAGKMPSISAKTSRYFSQGSPVPIHALLS